MPYKWFPIFKTGKHIDSEGKPFEATTETLDKLVSANNYKERPLAIGHPKTSSPAWGQANAFKRVGDILYAQPNHLVPEFEEAVKKRLWDKVSISIRPDMTIRHIGFLGATPPAVQGLPAVEFKEDESAMTFEFSEASAINTIGAIFQRLRDFLIEKWGQDSADRVINTYEIDDLKNVVPDDAQAGDGPCASSFASPDAAKVAQEARAKRYGIGIKDGGNITKPTEYAGIHDDEFMDPVNYRYPMDEVHMQSAMSYWGKPANRAQYTAAEVKIMTNRMLVAAKKHGITADPNNWNFSEKEEDMGDVEQLKKEAAEKDAKIAEFSEAKKKTDAELAAEREKNRRLEAEGRQREFASFCEGLMKEGKLTPAMRPAVMDFMEILSGSVEFEFAEINAEGKETKAKAQPLERFKTLLSGLPKQVEFSEFATKGKAGERQGTADESPVVSEARKRADAQKK